MTAAPGTTLYYLCAVHPWMQGKVNVVARWYRCRRRPASGTAGQSSARRRLGRRAFLGALGGGALAALLPLRGGSGGLLPLAAGPPRRSPPCPFRARLPIPPVLDDDRIRIPIREAEQQIFPGRKTRLWTYGGSFPGPTIRRRAGQRTRVTFRPPAAGEGRRALRSTSTAATTAPSSTASPAA